MVAGLSAGAAQAEIVSQSPNLSAADSETISYRFDLGDGVITTRVGFLGYPPAYGSLFGQYDIDSGEDYFLGEGYTSAGGYSATVAPVSAGASIGASSGWTAQTRTSTSISSTYYGLRIDQGGGNYTYGWALVSLGGSGVGSTQLLSLAFERTLNQAITAGTLSSVPEPASFAVVAGGLAVALTGMRRRRRGCA